jgi:tRNA(fMet)-specific endonuclease VapC
VAVTYLLDTNAWIAYLRQKDAALLQKFHQVNASDIRLCSVVLAELYYGAFHSAPAYQAHNLGLLVQLGRQFASVPFDDRAAEQYGRIRADLAAKGTPIGPHDLLIAAIALANGLTLVTHNTVEFNRVIGLTLDDWQTP